MEKKHYCYLLFNEENQTTYNGYTNDLKRRLRQHNGELRGGAKATRRSSTWRYLAVVGCDAFTKHTALSFEWHVRYPTNKRPRPNEYTGPEGRLRSLPLVFKNDKFKELAFRLWVDNTHRESIPECGPNVVLSDDLFIV